EGKDLKLLRKVQDECEALLTALKSAVILSGFSGGGYQYSNGVSVFFPWSREGYEVSKKNYEGLFFVEERQEKGKRSWTDFLKRYLFEVSVRKLEQPNPDVPVGSRVRYNSGVPFDERSDSVVSFGSRAVKGKIAGHEGTRIAGHEGTRIAGHEGTRIAGHEGTRIAGHEGTRIAGHEGTRIAGHEGTRIAGHEGTRLAGGGQSGFFDNLKLFKNVESRWDISGFTKKPEEPQTGY
ncbi:MAG TPA: hypothetical protein VFR12_01090, partial [Pyrinomonadaceae bacterium]|nr:hypothetical protein [Pyrinomonadaceae bacterium]